jgi:hypothetical protein
MVLETAANRPGTPSFLNGIQEVGGFDSARLHQQVPGTDRRIDQTSPTGTFLPLSDPRLAPSHCRVCHESSAAARAARPGSSRARTRRMARNRRIELAHRIEPGRSSDLALRPRPAFAIENATWHARHVAAHRGGELQIPADPARTTPAAAGRDDLNGLDCGGTRDIGGGRRRAARLHLVLDESVSSQEVANRCQAIRLDSAREQRCFGPLGPKRVLPGRSGRASRPGGRTSLTERQ